MAGNGDLPTINPDELAELAWGLDRDERPENAGEHAGALPGFGAGLRHR
ncbi:hypothetical protein [Mycolicibacterium fortuitum]|nr:hypothetical protein [Mycolicibacterium fortuitum]